MKKILILIITLMTAFGGVDVYALDITSKAACVINTETGEFYYDFNADEPLAPASMAKVMTAYIIYEKLAEGVIGKDTLITADAEDEMASLDSEATNVFLRAGNSYSIDELLGAIMVPSACAACEMVGKYLCGSKEAFWDLMNQKVAELGLEAYYADASGLSDDTSISARSMAILASKLINDYPDILNYTSKPYIIFEGRMYKSTNHMLPGDTWEYPGTDGFKTGTTTLAGYCNTSTAVRDGVRLLSVTMHSESPYDRFADTINLLDYGFEQARYFYDNLFATDMGVVINGHEMPSFYYGGANKGLCFIIEDLKDYGFDLHWSDLTRTVTAVYNPNKAVKPIPLDSYKAYAPGSPMYGIIGGSDITAEIVYNGNIYTLSNVYALGGYTAVSADEFGAAADSCSWSDAEKRLHIEFN